jgi:hypothetical protein
LQISPTPLSGLDHLFAVFPRSSVLYPPGPAFQELDTPVLLPLPPLPVVVEPRLLSAYFSVEGPIQEPLPLPLPPLPEVEGVHVLPVLLLPLPPLPLLVAHPRVPEPVSPPAVASWGPRTDIPLGVGEGVHFASEVPPLPVEEHMQVLPEVEGVGVLPVLPVLPVPLLLPVRNREDFVLEPVLVPVLPQPLPVHAPVRGHEILPQCHRCPLHRLQLQPDVQLALQLQLQPVRRGEDRC